jgi:2-polyprenyl-3-methyl-5-hydroxy-6-metoxy-1,4-benzoquinol methylase
MFERIALEVDEGADVVELGCGVGILGSKLTAQRRVRWSGYDISPTAVDMCKARFLDADVLDLREFTPGRIGTDEIVVISETLEHLERDAAVELLGKIRESSAQRLIITTPNNCMGPNEVPEHTALFNEEYLRAMLEEAGFAAESTTCSEADDHHLLCVVDREI